MQKFSDFVKSNEVKNENKENSYDNKHESFNNATDMQSKIDEYSKYSSDKLLNEFIRLTVEKKRKGELTEKELENLKNTIIPMLNSDQKQTLENLLQMVKNVK